MSAFVMPTEACPTAIRCSCYGFSATTGKARGPFGSYKFSLWVNNPRFGGTFNSSAAISLVLMLFCMFDNNNDG
ncbi:hypothetical protein H310_11629 [Aphanomyces invadans]|uniref:Uncharacterized protein n=1 Tax=Aphanomyces invadans TaxID=157072 RepID=A0A024TKF3_9STRA|nr:hypothetical protein H310_11629 [Aphanomyces invadans]ETV94635.1 hypothetical protein H310_11629 [Aphanomyces invadans]|eukprot:XP_008876580.1 hypothetical protein H310_11629 [Aphanomyces invadans]